MDLPTTVKCPICDGTGGGWAVWGQLDTHYDCPRCNGSGRLSAPAPVPSLSETEEKP